MRRWPSLTNTSAICANIAISIDVGDKDGLRNDTSKLHDAMDKYDIANSFDLYQGTHTSAVAVRFQNYVFAVLQQASVFQRRL